MSTMQKIIKDDVKLKYEKMQKKVIRQMMNPEKTTMIKKSVCLNGRQLRKISSIRDMSIIKKTIRRKI